MFEEVGVASRRSSSECSERVETQDLRATLARLATYHGADLTDTERIDQIALLEQLKSAAAAAQARITCAFARSQRSLAELRGAPAARRSQGLAEQIALARRESPTRGSQHLGLAHALAEMPQTMAALSAGVTSEWRATLVARETATLSREDRSAVDAEVGPRLSELGDRQVAAEARRTAYRLDPHSLIERTSRAEADRTVTVRPAPDTMTYLTGLLPVAKGVAVYAALREHAESRRSAGDERSLGQLMADTLVARVTGLADRALPPVEVHLVMTDSALLGRADEPAAILGHGPLPAWLARRVVRDTDDVWLRRLFTRPRSRELVATDSRRRLFSGQQRRLLVVRDQVCRTPWCGAPIKHADHVVPADAGGPTSLDNGQGLCERCNHAKQAPGWHARPDLWSERHRVVMETPTGHTYSSGAPPPPGQVA